jgi:carbon monoxide dehydrogenase subunit G
MDQPAQEEVKVMATFDKTIVIAAPIGKVFDYIQQPDRFSNLLPITGLTFLTNMHRGVSTRVRYNLNLGGKQVVTECSLTDVEVDKAVRYRTTSGVMFDWHITLEEVEEGTRLRWQGEYQAPVGFMDKLLGRSASMQQAMEAVIDDSMNKLKETLESE